MHIMPDICVREPCCTDTKDIMRVGRAKSVREGHASDGNMFSFQQLSMSDSGRSSKLHINEGKYIPSHSDSYL